MSDSGNIAAMQRELGCQLAAQRREAGLTQHGLAALAGFSRTTVSMAEIVRIFPAALFNFDRRWRCQGSVSFVCVGTFGEGIQ